MTFDTVKPSDIFQCEQCGECCKGYGGTFVTEKDIKAIAAYIKTNQETFVEDYCQMSGNKPMLAQAKNGYCIFWNKLCTIHSVKPYMCKAWPFIRSVLIDISNWEIIGASCPGIRTDIPNHVVQKCIKRKLSEF